MRKVIVGNHLYYGCTFKCNAAPNIKCPVFCFSFFKARYGLINVLSTLRVT